MATNSSALWCVVPAAGRSTRVGGEIPKQYLPLGGKPMLMQTLTRLAAHPRIAGVMVVLAPDDKYWAGMQTPARKTRAHRGRRRRARGFGAAGLRSACATKWKIPNLYSCTTRRGRACARRYRRG